MKIRIILQERDYYDEAAYQIEDLLKEAWEPIKSGDTSLAPYLGELAPTSQEFERRILFRQDTAKKIASIFTKHFLIKMKEHDKHNGYNKQESVS